MAAGEAGMPRTAGCPEEEADMEDSAGRKDVAMTESRPGSRRRFLATAGLAAAAPVLGATAARAATAARVRPLEAGPASALGRVS